MPCKHLAAVCYVLAEAFDDDPFAMLAWRGKSRDDLLAALRRLTGRGQAQQSSRPVIDIADRPLAECIAGFWSTRLSPARLRALPPATAAPPDLLLRSLEPPLLGLQGQDLVSVLRPAYYLMAGQESADEHDRPSRPARA